MQKISLTLLDSQQNIRTAKSDPEFIALTYRGEYQQGDVIMLDVAELPCHLMVQLEDSLPPCLIYLTHSPLCFTVPFGDTARAYSDKAFTGGKHFLSVRLAYSWELDATRNLAFNPYYQEAQEGVYPRAIANIPSQNIRFAPRCAIDGVFDSSEHGSYPFTSWSNAQQADARLSIEFGREVTINAVMLTLRADFPHDSYWQCVELQLGEYCQSVSLQRSGKPQLITINPAVIASKVSLTKLEKAEESSPFTALTQIAVIGQG